MNKISQPLFVILTGCVLIFLSLAACTGLAAKSQVSFPFEDAQKVTIRDVLLGAIPCGTDFVGSYERFITLSRTPTQFEGTVSFSWGENTLEKPIILPLKTMTGFLEKIKKAPLQVGEFPTATCDPSYTSSIALQLGTNSIEYLMDCLDRNLWKVSWSEKGDLSYYVEYDKFSQALAILEPFLQQVGDLNFDTCSIEP
jgi:hypothetical protein